MELLHKQCSNWVFIEFMVWKMVMVMNNLSNRNY